MPANSRAPWNTIATPRRDRMWGGSRSMCVPARLIEPESGRRWPAIRLNSVDLPAPFGPITPRSSPSATSRLTSRLA